MTNMGLDFTTQDWTFLYTGFSGSLVLLFTAMAAKSLTTSIFNSDPLSFFTFYCQQLAAKVNKSQNSSSQQRIAGFVAILITLLPLAIILSLFENLVAVPWLWQCLLLWLALGWTQSKKQSIAMLAALRSKQKRLAKERLNPFVLRETENLTPMGLCKASIEMNILRFIQEYFTIIIFFLCFGAVSALMYRLLQIMHHSWNTKLQSFTHFGQSANALVKLCIWLPTRLLTFILLLASINNNYILYWRLIHQQFFSGSNTVLVHAVALTNKVKLGGPAIYQGVKVRHAVFNELARQPDENDVNTSIALLNGLLRITLMPLAIVSVLLQFVS